MCFTPSTSSVTEISGLSPNSSLQDIVSAAAKWTKSSISSVPLSSPLIGSQCPEGRRLTRLAALAAVATCLSEDGTVDVDVELCDVPRSSCLQHRLVQDRLDAWIAALLGAASDSCASRVVCSTMVFQFAGRHEMRRALGFKKLAYQYPIFRQAPRVHITVNTPSSRMCTDLLWRALSNIIALDLTFEVGHQEQTMFLKSMRKSPVRCLSLTGCDAHISCIHQSLCATLRQIPGLEAFQMGPRVSSDSPRPECTLNCRQIDKLRLALLRAYRIVGINFSNEALQEELSSRLPWCNSVYGAQHITEVLAGKAHGSTPRGNPSCVEAAISALQGIISFEESLQEIAPEIMKLIPPEAAPVC